MFWTYRYLRTRLNKKVYEFELAALEDKNSENLFGGAKGARWHRLPDGSWQRWSYLGNDWEKATAPAPLVEAANANLAITEWTAGPDGSWHPYDPEAARAEEESADADEPALPGTPSSPAPEKTHAEKDPPPRLDPDYVPRPEWTSDWKPGWNQDLK